MINPNPHIEIEINQNIEKVLKVTPSQLFFEGEIWYNEAHEFCTSLSLEFNKTIRQVAGITATCSVMKSWELNKRMVRELLETGSTGTFSRQLDRSIQIINLIGTDLNPEKTDKITMNIIGGRKTKSFYHNIVYPEKSNLVTIDRHMIKLFPKTWTPMITEKRYSIVEECIQSKAIKLNLLPLQLQAVLWLQLKRK